MSDLSILPSQTSTPTKVGFWKQQFAEEGTRPQTVFDIMFGVIAPVLCFAFDPIVFQGGFLGPPLFPQYQAFVYIVSGLEVTVLCLWLLCGAAFHLWNGLIGGVLIWGGIFSALVGLILLPFAVAGIAFGIGVFGFIPFVTAIVYLRNGVRAWHSQNENASFSLRGATVVLSLVLIVGIPLALSNAIHVYVENSVATIIKGDSQQALVAAQGLKPLSFFASSELDQLVNAYVSEADPDRKQILKSCYQEITGKDIEVRARIVLD